MKIGPRLGFSNMLRGPSSGSNTPKNALEGLQLGISTLQVLLHPKIARANRVGRRNAARAACLRPRAVARAGGRGRSLAYGFRFREMTPNRPSRFPTGSVERNTGPAARRSPPRTPSSGTKPLPRTTRRNSCSATGFWGEQERNSPRTRGRSLRRVRPRKVWPRTRPARRRPWRLR